MFIRHLLACLVPWLLFLPEISHFLEFLFLDKITKASLCLAHFYPFSASPYHTLFLFLLSTRLGRAFCRHTLRLSGCTAGLGSCQLEFHFLLISPSWSCWTLVPKCMSCCSLRVGADSIFQIFCALNASGNSEQPSSGYT